MLHNDMKILTMINPDSLIDPERLEEGAIEVGEEKLKFIKRKIEK